MCGDSPKESELRFGGRWQAGETNRLIGPGGSGDSLGPLMAGEYSEKTRCSVLALLDGPGREPRRSGQSRLILVNGMPSTNRAPMNHHGCLSTGLSVWSPGRESPGASFSTSSLGIGRALGPSSDSVGARYGSRRRIRADCRFGAADSACCSLPIGLGMVRSLSSVASSLLTVPASLGWSRGVVSRRLRPGSRRRCRR